MTTHQPQDLMDACRELAQHAGLILSQRFTRPRTVEHKGTNDLVTDADRASEEWLIAEVARRFPGHAVLAEESGAHAGLDGASLIWVMDPLDGTTNYAHAFPHFCVSVAVCEPSMRPLAGCVHDPMRQESFAGARGLGAWLHTSEGTRRMAVTGTQRIEDSLLATGFPYDRAEHADNNHAEHDAMSMVSHGVRRPGAAALDLAYVAAGRLDAYWEAHLKPWDVAAGALLVEEAGGVVTGYDGVPFDGRQSAVVSGGPLLQPRLRQALQVVREGQGFPTSPQRTSKPKA
jgi:myo-inositol-1(or 4)-monophosphatase